ncbi:RNA polymerase sigma factor [Kitasatospora sp. NPDC085464]|uniref:RNA polymerase sigma factor n=1 Tax=Kitasatospora sp. NPDC085464 TaxID=3364063 RepID=UPI0037CB5743
MVVAAQGGDAQALAALVTAAHPHVRRFAHSLCAGREDAEDAAQEALIVLYRRIGMLRASTALASWMFRIVRNECLRRARAVLRDHPPGHTAGAAGGQDGEGGAGAGGGQSGGGGEAGWASAEEEALRRLEAHRIAQAIAALPGDQRRVLVLRDVQGRSGRAVAEELGIGQGAMKSRLHRARAALRHTLTTTPPPPPVPVPAPVAAAVAAAAPASAVPVAAGGRAR